jgi:SanA protein
MLKKNLYTIFYIIIAIVIVVLSIDSYIKDNTKSKIYTKIEDIPKRNVALVLGTAKYVKRGKINYFYKYRIDAVAKLFKAGKVKAILVSGDNATRYYNEPRRMYKDLVKAGIPKSKIYLDFAGFRTLDSILRAKNIFNLKSFIIVTQRFHLERALFIANKNGLDAIGFVAKDIPNTKAALRMRAREYFARVKAFLDVYILHTTPKFFGKFEKIPIKENEIDK